MLLKQPGTTGSSKRIFVGIVNRFNLLVVLLLVLSPLLHGSVVSFQLLGIVPFEGTGKFVQEFTDDEGFFIAKARWIKNHGGLFVGHCSTPIASLSISSGK